MATVAIILKISGPHIIISVTITISIMLMVSNDRNRKMYKETCIWGRVPEIMKLFQ